MLATDLPFTPASADPNTWRPGQYLLGRVGRRGSRPWNGGVVYLVEVRGEISLVNPDPYCLRSRKDIRPLIPTEPVWVKTAWLEPVPVDYLIPPVPLDYFEGLLPFGEHRPAHLLDLDAIYNHPWREAEPIDPAQLFPGTRLMLRTDRITATPRIVREWQGNQIVATFIGGSPCRTFLIDPKDIGCVNPPTLPEFSWADSAPVPAPATPLLDDLPI